MEVGGNEIENSVKKDISVDEIDTDNSSADNKSLHNASIDTDIGTKSSVPSGCVPKLESSNDNEEQNPEEKLCGWLLLRARGIGNLKGSRKRWFIFGEENCKLYFYRDPKDLLPLGEINIALSSFYFDAGNIDKPGLFEIKCDGKDVQLDAGNRRNMMYWLQALQTKRRNYSLSRVSVSTDRVGQWSQNRTSQFGGLLSKESDSPSTSRRVFDPGDAVMDHIPEIHLSVSETHSSNGSLNSIPSNSQKTKPLWALNNLKSEIQQKLSGIKIPGKTGKESVFYYDVTSALKDSDQMSTSTTSINSVDSLVHTTNPSLNTELNKQAGSQTCDNKPRTGSQYSDSSQLDVPVTKTFRSSSLDQPSVSTMAKDRSLQRKIKSWTIIDKQDAEDFPEGQGQTERSQPSSECEGQVISEKVQKGNFMSTLKKIRIGKRQVSEPGTMLSKPSTDKAGIICPKCKIVVAPALPSPGGSKDVIDLEEELQANREVISLLQKNLQEQARETESRKQVGDLDNEGRITMLLERDKQIEELQQQLSTMTDTCNKATEKLRLTESEMKTSQEQASMYSDMLKAKDEILMRLTNQIFDHDQEKQDQAPGNYDQPDVVQANNSFRESTSSLRSDKTDEKEMERMRDMCAGYELQHKFLTKEILELNELRKLDESREKKLMMDFAKVQAKYYQVKSKYYVVLKQQKELSPVRGDAEEGQEVVTQLLQDALEIDNDDIELHLTGSGPEYDKYGFSHRHFTDEEEEDQSTDPLSNKASELERQSEELNSNIKNATHDASLHVKWENYMVGRVGKLQRNNELKLLLRQGVPHEYREQVWKGCVQLYVGTEREKRGPDFYHSLLQRKETATGSDPAIKQIELDLLRTLPNNKHYDTIESEGILKLRRVLLAFSEYNKVIGYCQGLNRLAAIALLFLNEEDAFWCLVAIVDYILPQDYFSSSLLAAQADQRVLKDLVADKLPKIHHQLESHGVDLSLFTFNWFLTIYVDNIPTETFLRIWDTFLFEGSKVLFRFAVAFLKMSEAEILQQKDGLQLNRYLRRIGENMTKITKICEYAFQWINPFGMRFLANRRQQHIQDIKVELSELDKLRYGMKITREQQEEYYSDDDLDN